MKFKRSLLIFSLLLVALLCVSSVAANDSDYNITEDSSALGLSIDESNNIADDQLAVYNEDEVVSEPQTIVVSAEPGHNEMSDSTIQKAIDDANEGDTIIINGTSYVHCHFVVNKKLTIKSNIGTTMEVCPGSTAGSGYHGIFYVSPEASGTIIEGFTIKNNVYNDDDYAIFVNGASDIIIRNCSIENTGSADTVRIENAKNVNIQNMTLSNAENGIRVKNSENVKVTESSITGNDNGINIIDSTQIKISENNIYKNKVSGIAFSGNGKELTVIYNNLTENGDGLRITSTNNVYILANYIAFNKNNGVYVDYDINYIEIKGNFFNQNIKWDVFNDFHVKNMKDNGNNREIVDNNYMINYGFGSGDMDRPVWTQMYEYRPGTSYADYSYDESKDVFTYVGEGNGNYYGHQEVMFMMHVFDINNFLSCPNMYYAPEKIWSKVGGLELKLSEITQIKKGVYSISIIDENGNVATDLGSVPITFYLNKVGTSSTPKEGDVYKVVMMKNGTATVSFDGSVFGETGNVITAVSPTPGTNIDNKVSKTFNVADSDIPGEVLNTTIVSSNVYMVPKMSENYVITLKDALGNILSNKTVTFTVNGKTYDRTTDKNGQAKVSLKFTSEKTYEVKISFAGDEEYNPISKTNKITVKYSSKALKLTAPTITIPPKTSRSYTVTLTDGNGKGIAKQTIVIKINEKTYTKTTNSNGKASVSVKFDSLKSYKVSVTYKGSNVYKKASVTGKINVAKINTKITAPTVSVLPKQSKYYSITLKTSDGKTLSNKKVTIKVNGKTYTKKTNSKGQAGVFVKLSSEKTYPVTVKFDGDQTYKGSKATGKIVVSKIGTVVKSYDRTFSKGYSNKYQITLSDKSGNGLSKQTVKLTINGKTYTKTTDSKGKAILTLPNLNVGSFKIVTKFVGNNKYKAVSKTNKISILNTGVVYVDDGLPNSDIQDILNNAPDGSDVEFLGDSYDNIDLSINKALNIYSKDKTLLIAKVNSPVFKVSANGVNITNLIIKGNANDGIQIVNVEKVVISNNFFINKLDESKIEDYVNGTEMLPGYGIAISNSTGISISKNDISQFESGVFAQYSSEIAIDNNAIRENNYGIKYGFGVSNTQITNNEISQQIGLYIMTVPEGPSGYGIFLNNSAVNVTINHNHIAYNHMGISLDAKNSTGIVITQNTITDNVLEGIRFNAPYDLAENAVRAIVTDNAIYRNARGPSMMILGELSANPEGIYGGGLLNPEERLQLDANWYGKNDYTTWDIDSGVVGYGTMCPRINTTYIVFRDIGYISPGKYNITFYKNGEIASNISEFDLYATLNRGTDKQTEITFNVAGGVGVFEFDANYYNSDNNTIEISIGSLINSTSRIFLPAYSYDVPKSEIPI